MIVKELIEILQKKDQEKEIKLPIDYEFGAAEIIDITEWDDKIGTYYVIL